MLCLRLCLWCVCVRYRVAVYVRYTCHVCTETALFLAQPTTYILWHVCNLGSERSGVGPQVAIENVGSERSGVGPHVLLPTPPRRRGAPGGFLRSSRTCQEVVCVCSSLLYILRRITSYHNGPRGYGILQPAGLTRSYTLRQGRGGNAAGDVLFVETSKDQGVRR